MWTGFDRVYPEMVCGGVLRFLLQYTLEERKRLLLALARFPVVVIAIVDGSGKSDAGIGIAGVLLHQGAQDFDFVIEFCFVLGAGSVANRCLVGLGSLNVELLPRCRMPFQCNRFFQRRLRVGLGYAVVKALRLVKTPIAHGAIGVGADGFFKGPIRLVIPKIVKQVVSLLEPRLGLGITGNRKAHIANAFNALRG